MIAAGVQAALRRVAMLVGEGARPEELFAAVAEEVGRVVDAPYVVVARYDSGDIATVCGTFPLEGPLFRAGRHISLDGVSVLSHAYVRTESPRASTTTPR